MSDEGMGVQFDLMGALETYEITRLIESIEFGVPGPIID